MGTIALAGTLDTKGPEYAYVKQILEQLGNHVLTINTGVYQPYFQPDIGADQVLATIGSTVSAVQQADRGQATTLLADGFAKLLPELYRQKRFDGVLCFGGSGGTSVLTPGMRELPIGVPKLMVSTVASGDTSVYVGTSDIIMMPSIVDVSGLNKLSKVIFDNAAAAISGLVNTKFDQEVDTKPLIGASMFGVTTPAVDHARELLQDKGYETLVFHATGTGGRTLEHLVKNDYFVGVLDLTTTEMADELVGGVLSAGPQRLEAAVAAGLPEVVCPGALDMVNFGPFETVPKQFSNRKLFKHNPTVTLMRTTVSENQELGRRMAAKLNQAIAPVTVMIPTKGFSKIDALGQPFYGPDEDLAFTNSLKQTLTNKLIEVRELPNNIDDPAFSSACVTELLRLIAVRTKA
ncbi:Tm-1-like ATP-binding domain-containing protein [Lapidilactobacillus achengensis]|uniref:Tm-1-like ATP-binding domain-containing protein n=1 Tax=Lapidilactobacillus achengensis TaxID=2486000 RepID=A0ABW1UP73_9LACO|nr:Tm-1-like ATP-binding domain-containing protein [Lapidilactobacillus achengensis]